MPFIEDEQTVAPVEDTEGKHSVFLVGDSIRLGYCHTVRSELEPIATVYFTEENNRSTQFVIPHLCNWSKMCNRDRVEVFHFNCGMWDVAHWDGDERSLTSPEEYRYNIDRIIRHAKVFFPNAKIVFATTTTMNPACKGENRNPRTNAEIAAYNRIALDVCKKYNVIINDLNAFTQSWEADCYRDYCHFTPESFTVLGKRVADFIRNLL